MKLKDIITQLEYGELGKINLGANRKEGVSSYNYPEIISAINLGLIDLYARFDLKSRYTYLKQENHITFYELDRKYAETNTTSTETYKYIKDTVENPFTGSILKILGIFNESGIEYRLNDNTDPASYYTPTLTTIQIPVPDASKTVCITYVAAPETLEITGDTVLEQEVYLPILLLKSLLMFVTSRIVANLPMLEANSKSAEFYNKYLAAITEAENFGVRVSDNTKNTKLEFNGWA
jgi:hypothetical protein